MKNFKSWDHKKTLQILSEHKYNHKDWDRINHTSKNIITLSRERKGKIETITIKL